MSSANGRLSAADAAKLFVGSRLTLARHLAGMRKNELAESIGKTPTAVASYETGRSRPAAATVAKLCIALAVEPAFFLATPGTERSEPNSLEPHYRSLRSTTQLVRNQATAYGWLVHDIVAVFERYVEMPSIAVPEYSLSDQEPVYRPVSAAQALRKVWGLGTEPIRHMLRLAENHGLICVFSPFQIATVDAYSFESKVRPIIVLNPLKGDYYRQRWDLAHEIGHLVLHRDAEPGNHVAEVEAHRFAAELLLPTLPIREQLPHRPIWPRLQALKEYWGVSMQALLYRARELGIHSDVTYRNAMMRMSQEGWRRQEPGPRPCVEQPSILPSALELLQGSGIPAVQLASEARVPMNIFRLVTARKVEAAEADPLIQPDDEKSDKKADNSNVISLLSNSHYF
jgi:Zn-dependent peptidase ImmA (M78 family)/transcriptional regulator with XRE-family HTH domain